MANDLIKAQPIVIVGAGRSGTNILRDVLTELRSVETWPCDEINYIWRHGNRDFPTDELTVHHARTDVSGFIRTQFNNMINSSSLQHESESARYIVEKTCANSLRVPFVDAVIPEAKYIFLVRDGRDVIASAKQRWKAPLDIPYLLAKAKFVPKSDLMHYAGKYFVNRVLKRANREKALSVWGPKFSGMREISKSKSLEYLCAAQWVSCVDSSQNAFNKMAPEKYIRIYYEDLVAHPVDTLKSIVSFLGSSHDEEEISLACRKVRSGSVGKGRLEKLPSEIVEVMENTMDAHGYLL